MEARDSEWQWHQLGHMQVCTSLQTDNHASTPPLSFFTGRMPFLPPNQQHQSTEGTVHDINHTYISVNTQNSCPLNASLCYATYICQPLLESRTPAHWAQSGSRFAAVSACWETDRRSDATQFHRPYITYYTGSGRLYFSAKTLVLNQTSV